MMSNKTVMIWRWFWGLNGAVVVVVDSMCRFFFINIFPPSPSPPTYERSYKKYEPKETA